MGRKTKTSTAIVKTSKASSRANLENPQIPITGFGLSSSGGSGSSGVTMFGAVTPEMAMRQSAVYACVRVIAESVASLPLDLLQKTVDASGNTSKVLAEANPIYKYVHDKPNEMMNSFAWRESAMVSVLLKGNHYSYIERSNGGAVTGLLPLDADQVQIGVSKGRKVFYYKPADLEIDNADMLHIFGLSWDGLIGVSSIRYARAAITLALAAEDYGSRYFANGANPSGVLETGKVLKDEAYKRLRESWEATYSGLKGSHKVVMLEEGMTFKPITITNRDSQFLDARKFQINDICRMFRVPPHMIGDLERATNNNIEQQSLEFVRDTLRPWVVRWEQELNSKLLSSLPTHYFQFNLDGLLRGDIRSRYEAYHIGRNAGFMSANDIRASENLNGIGPQGDIYIVPSGTVSAATLLMPTPTDTDGDGDTEENAKEDTANDDLAAASSGADDGGGRKALNAIVEAATIPLAACLSRLIGNEATALRKAVVKADTSKAVEDFYGKFGKTLLEAVSPAFQGIGGARAALCGTSPSVAMKAATAHAETFVASYIANALGELSGAADIEPIIEARIAAAPNIAKASAIELANQIETLGGVHE